MQFKLFPLLRLSLTLAILTLFLPGRFALAEDNVDTNRPSLNAEPKAAEQDAAETQKILRDYIRLQEQLHAAILAIEQNRQETSAAVARNAENMQQRLETIEKSVLLQRAEQVDAVHNSNKLVLTLASLFAGFGFLAVVFASWMQFRAMGKWAEIAAAFPATQALHQPRFAGTLTMGEDLPVQPTPEAEQSTLRLRNLLQSLESRVRELEHTAHVIEPEPKPAHKNGGTRHHEAVATVEPPSPAPARLDRVTVLLGKGQSLLNLNEADQALGCFDQVLAIDPDNAEALIKKGTALERLRRLEEAIDCYDRAIEVNKGMTLAYLYKGGVYNQLERFNEALECYEQALRSQQQAEHAS